MKVVCRLLFCLFCCLTFLPLQCWACSCPFPTQDRRDTICRALNDTRWTPVIYKATVTSSYCKCLASSSPSNIYSCINFYSNNGTVVGNVQRAFQCQDNPQFSFYYHERCPVVIERSGINFSSVANGSVPIESITCSNISFTSNTASGCSITHQPCYYTVTVDAVYKGDMYQVGQSVNTSGPDVLTTCGQYRRVLTVGSSYIVGIGGPCVPISDWESFDSYSSSEIQLLENNDRNCSTMPSATTSSINVVTTSNINVVTNSTTDFVNPSQTGKLTGGTGRLSEQEVIIVAVTTPVVLVVLFIIGLIVTGLCVIVLIIRKTKKPRTKHEGIVRQNSMTKAALLTDENENENECEVTLAVK